MKRAALVAEDDKLWADRLVRVFEHAGYEVERADSWDQVANKVLRKTFELFTCDLALGHSTESGVEMLTYLEGRYKGKTIVISNAINTKILQRCHELTFVDNVISKTSIEYHFEYLAKIIGGLTSGEVEELFYGANVNIEPVLRNDMAMSKTVFVVHGRNEQFVDELMLLLRAVGLLPQSFDKIINDAGSGAPYIGAAISKTLSLCGGIIVILAPDDEVRLRKIFQLADDPAYERRLTGQPRPNVLFEAGIAFGLRPDHTILLRVGAIRPVSDLGGRHFLDFVGDNESKVKLVERLRAIGCNVNADDGKWVDSGNFAGALSPYV